MTATNDQFYALLPASHLSLAELLLEDELFYRVPADWYVVITDIKSSTAAVKKGLHENVNLVAAGSIISVLNIAFKENITVPFFFGGDGATFLLPSHLIEKVIPALLLFKDRTLVDFGLELRIGHVAVAKIYEQGHQLNICKFSFSDFFPIPIVLGGGLNYAESIVKGNDYLLSGHNVQEEELDLSGMQCRWDRIPPPENKEEVVTLLVMAREGQPQNIVFSRVMQRVDEIYGLPGKRQPISVAKLRLKTTFNRVKKEMRTRMGKIKYVDAFYAWFISLLGVWYFKTQKGRRYLGRLVDMSDTLVMDGKINTVMSGTAKQRGDLEMALNSLEAAGQIFYGIHVSSSSIMSCYVRDMEDGHIHFVDGSEGGYTKAAIMLKSKWRK